MNFLILFFFFLRIFYAHQHYDGDLTVPALGEAMAAQVKGRWIRAKVIGLDVEKGLVQVKCR